MPIIQWHAMDSIFLDRCFALGQGQSKDQTQKERQSRVTSLGLGLAHFGRGHFILVQKIPDLERTPSPRALRATHNLFLNLTIKLVEHNDVRGHFQIKPTSVVVNIDKEHTLLTALITVECVADAIGIPFEVCGLNTHLHKDLVRIRETPVIG